MKDNIMERGTHYQSNPDIKEKERNENTFIC